MLGPTSEPPSLSGGSCYICCPPPAAFPFPPFPISPPPPLCIHVVLCSAAACSLISTNKFILDTNYSSATSGGAVGRSNERQQSPHHRGPPFPPHLLFSWAPSVTGQQWIFVFFFSSFFLFPPQHWVKGGFFKGRRTRRVRSQGGARCSPGKGRFFFSSISRVDGSGGGGSPGDSASRASLER